MVCVRLLVTCFDVAEDLRRGLQGVKVMKQCSVDRCLPKKPKQVVQDVVKDLMLSRLRHGLAI